MTNLLHVAAVLLHTVLKIITFTIMKFCPACNVKVYSATCHIILRAICV